MVLEIVLVLQMVDKNDTSKRTFQKVFKRNGARVRGLWKRGDRFYAQLTILDYLNIKKVRRVPLQANNLTDAVNEMYSLKKDHQHPFPALQKDISFTRYADRYLMKNMDLKLKSPNTLKSERYMLSFWKEILGNISLKKVHRPNLEEGIRRRINRQNSTRTINLSLTVLGNLLEEGVKEGLIKENPAKQIRKRKLPKPDRSHFDTTQINALCDAATTKLKYGDRFANFIKFLCFCGARVSEGLCVSWRHVDWENEQIILGADGETKNRQSRRIDFNSNLSGLLVHMATNKINEKWLFPSTMRGREFEHARTYKESLKISKNAAGLTSFTFHACRRYFISRAVMSGIDYMTIAKWVGHNDGGILIGKVYGHLSREHMKLQAQKFKA